MVNILFKCSLSTVFTLGTTHGFEARSPIWRRHPNTTPLPKGGNPPFETSPHVHLTETLGTTPSRPHMKSMGSRLMSRP